MCTILLSILLRDLRRFAAIEMLKWVILSLVIFCAFSAFFVSNIEGNIFSGSSISERKV